MKLKKYELNQLRCDNLNRLINEFNISDWFVREPETFLRELEIFTKRCHELDYQLLSLETEDDER